MEKMSLYKFTHICLLKIAQLKKSYKEPTKKKGKEKGNHLNLLKKKNHAQEKKKKSIKKKSRSVKSQKEKRKKKTRRRRAKRKKIVPMEFKIEFNALSSLNQTRRYHAKKKKKKKKENNN